MQKETVNPNIRTELIEVVVANIGVNEFSLGQLPNLEYIAKLSGGRVIKGRIPILTSSTQAA
jgi:hypothetical protein